MRSLLFLPRRALIVLLAPLLCCLSQAQTNASRELLVLRNGDKLFGTLQSFSPTNGLAWQHADVREPITFVTGSLAEVQFPEKNQPALPVTTNAFLVRFTNGDELPGNLLSLDAEQLQLDTWFAGVLAIPRPQVLSLTPLSPSPATIYDGPTGLEDWTQGKAIVAGAAPGEWKFHNRAFYTSSADGVRSASIARDLKLPPRASLEFDIAWRGQFTLAVGLGTDSMQPVNLMAKDNEPKFGGFYSLQINNSATILRFVKQGEPLRTLGSAFTPQLSQTNHAHLAIKMDKDQRTIVLLINDAVAQRFVDPEGFGAAGTGVRFVYGGFGAFKLGGLRLTHWDGRMEERVPTPLNPAEDTALLLNRDRVGGTLQTVRAGKATFTIGNQTLEVPLARITMIELAATKAAPVKPHLTDVHVRLLPRGNVTGELLHWEAGRVALRSVNFGAVDFKPAAITRLEFPSKP